jgi:benzoyl-CoA reductase/2-hydroxyglutaryl-CoA dehydratase subunit BcrC/BadD/HgdB
MNARPQRISLSEWDARYGELLAAGMREPWYGGSLGRHAGEGDLRLPKLAYDNSPAALRLWNFLLTEEQRLHEARAQGKRLVGTMKDIGTVPVMAFAARDLVAFYPDGAWWIPCIMEKAACRSSHADALGFDESFCPVRAVLDAFVTQANFPIPDVLTCSVGATCDDFSAIAQRIESLGHPVFWWEVPHRREPDGGEEAVSLPGGFTAPLDQVAFVRRELERVRAFLEEQTREPLDDAALAAGIKAANGIRDVLRRLRHLAYEAEPCPMPALEMLIAEMLAIHYCSDRAECLAVLELLLREVARRVGDRAGVLERGAVRVFWVNPVADLRAMNLLEDAGGRICGTEYMFSHALDRIPEDVPPLEALAQMALADPMVGPARDRASRIVADIRLFRAEAVVVSRIPGASHCATEGEIIHDRVTRELGMPVVEIEVPSICDALLPTLRTRLEALVETAKERRER